MILPAALEKCAEIVDGKYASCWVLEPSEKSKESEEPH